MADLNITVVVLRPSSAAAGVVPATADQGRAAGAVLLRQPSAVRVPGQAGQEDPAKVEARAPDSTRAEPRVPAAAPTGVAAVAPVAVDPAADPAVAAAPAAPAAPGAVAGTPATGKQA